MQNHIIGGAIIERDGKYLMVQEAENHVDNCKGKWGAPGGHVDPGETIIEGAIREVKEETGCDVELTKICQIGTMGDPASTFLVVVFAAKIVNDVENFTSPEISTTRWFTYEELCTMQPELRSPELVLGSIDNLRTGITAPLDLIKIYPPIS